MPSNFSKISSDEAEVVLTANNVLVTELLVGTPSIQTAKELKQIWRDLVGGTKHAKICIFNSRFNFSKAFKDFEKEIVDEQCVAHAIVVPTNQTKHLIESFIMIQEGLKNIQVFTSLNQAKEWINGLQGVVPDVSKNEIIKN